jgi:hypothetical protein
MFGISLSDSQGVIAMKIGLFLHACRRFWILSNLPVKAVFRTALFAIMFHE